MRMSMAQVMALVVLISFCKIDEGGGSNGFGNDGTLSFVFDLRHSGLDERHEALRLAKSVALARCWHFLERTTKKAIEIS